MSVLENEINNSASADNDANGRPPAPDQGSLGFIGYLLGAAAAVVMMIGALVVGDHLTGKLNIDGALPTITVPAHAR